MRDRKRIVVERRKGVLKHKIIRDALTRQLYVRRLWCSAVFLLEIKGTSLWIFSFCTMATGNIY